MVCHYFFLHIFQFSVCGKRTDDGWFSEGRRITPIIQRGVPQTAFLLDADAVASKIASFKFKMPNKSKIPAINTECAQTNEKVASISCAEAVENVNKAVCFSQFMFELSSEFSYLFFIFGIIF